MNLFVAEFIGSPAMNLVEADLARDDGALVARFGEHRLRVADSLAAARPALASAVGRLALGIGPRTSRTPPSFPALPRTRRLTEVDIREDMGSEIYLHFAVAEPVATADIREAVEDAAVEAQQEEARRHGGPFVARAGRESGAREGDRIRIHVRTDRLHVFDLETGAAVYG